MGAYVVYSLIYEYLLIYNLCIFLVSSYMYRFKEDIFHPQNLLAMYVAFIFCLSPLILFGGALDIRPRYSIVMGCSLVFVTFLFLGMILSKSYSVIKIKRSKIKIKNMHASLLLALCVVMFISISYMAGVSPLRVYGEIDSLKSYTKTGAGAILLIAMFGVLNIILTGLMFSVTKDRKEYKPRLIYLMFFLVSSALVIPFGGRVMIFYFVMSSAFVYAYRVRRIPISFIVTGILALVVYSQAMFYYRAILKVDSVSDYSESGVSVVIERAKENVLLDLASRLFSYKLLYKTIKDYKSTGASYLYGASYIYPLIRLVPRALNPSKPFDTGGYLTSLFYPKWGVGRGGASMEATVISELFINGGWYFIVFGSLVLGLIIGIFIRIFDAGKSSDVLVMVFGLNTTYMLGLILSGINSAATQRFIIQILLLYLLVKVGYIKISNQKYMLNK